LQQRIQHSHHPISAKLLPAGQNISPLKVACEHVL
jgi:hypothetical protein